MKSSGITRPSGMVRSAPLYREVRRSILQCLAKGEWKPGEKIPTEPELAERFGVAIPTVRAGISELAAGGILIRRQGKGTFVARHDSHGPQFRFSNIYNNRGENVSSVRHIISMRKVAADHDAIDLLALNVRNPGSVYRLAAVLEVSEKPIAVMDLILPLPLFNRLRKEHLEQTRDNLYFVYQRVCGVTVIRMEERVYARVADKRLSKALGIKVDHPVLVVERLAFSFNDTPVEIRRRSFEGLEYHYLFIQNRFD